MRHKKQKRVSGKVALRSVPSHVPIPLRVTVCMTLENIFQLWTSGIISKLTIQFWTLGKNMKTKHGPENFILEIGNAFVVP